LKPGTGGGLARPARDLDPVRRRHRSAGGLLSPRPRWSL